MKKHIFNEQTGIGYTLQGDYYLPDLVVSEEKEQYIGLWGQRHLKHLKQHHKVLYYNLLTSGKLNDYIADVDKQAGKMFEKTVKSLAGNEGVTEKLKANSPMEWVRQKNE